MDRRVLAAVAVAGSATLVGSVATQASAADHAMGAAGSAGSSSASATAVHSSAQALPRLALRNVTRPGAATVTGATVPHFSSTFTVNGTSYPYTMVGSAPTGAAKTTTTATSITGLRVNLSDGSWTSINSNGINYTKQSALFTNKAFKTGTTQYGDAMLRGSFWKQVSTKAWHVRLGVPTVNSIVTLNVPANQGQVGFDSSGDVVPLVNIDWFDAQLRQRVSGKSATSLPIFLAYDVVLCSDYTDINTCGVGGYHSDLVNSTGTHTYSYASWMEPGVFGASGADLAAMSHEVSEWLFDPFVNNHVPNWSVPAQPQYGCSNMLETGDPLVGTTFVINQLHYQDEAFLSWFSRQKPSTGYKGWYSYLGTFRTFSPAC